jgi:hypothetical protein
MTSPVGQKSSMQPFNLKTTVPGLKAEVISGLMEELLSMASGYDFYGWQRARVELQFNAQDHEGKCISCQCNPRDHLFPTNACSGLRQTPHTPAASGPRNQT